MKLDVLWLVIKFVALVFVSFELFSIITNKNKKMSIAGTIVLAFSGCVMWNLDKIDSIVLGELITVLIYKIINQNSYKKIIPMMLIVILSSVGYMYTFRPFAISFGYIFLALIVWIITKNIKEIKSNKSKLIILCLTLILSIIAAISAEVFFGKIYNDYIEYNMTASISGLFTFLYTPFLAFKDVKNPDIWAGIISVFPIPLGIALYYMYKKEEHSEFILPIVLVTVFETVYCISGIPNILSKVTMFSGVSAVRVVPAIHLANLYIMFYFFSNVKDKMFKLRYQMRITIIFICILAFIQYPIQFSERGFLYLFVATLTLLTFLFLNYDEKNYQKVLLVLLVLFSVCSGIPVLFLI